MLQFQKKRYSTITTKDSLCAIEMCILL